MPLRQEHADRYRRETIGRPHGRRRGVVARADEEVPIAEILAELPPNNRRYVPSEIVTSWKVKCPFGDEHEDGGVEQDCRVYASNSLHCFAMHGTMKNSQLIAATQGVTRNRAAIMILSKRNLLRSGTYQERWAELKNRQKQNQPGLGNPAYVVQALQTRLSANPAYVEHEFTPEVMSAWEGQLKALDAMIADGQHGLDPLRAWFESALTVITTAALT